jgi:branched-chain amino acid transport system ATP-binding protein
MAFLEVRGIVKRFGGIVALDDVSIALEQGEAVGLVGPNGAGKTTLFDCLNGVRRVDSGEINFLGRRIEGLPVYKRARLGIGRTFQRLELFAGMSAREHLMVAERVHRGDGRLWKDLIGRGREREPVPRVEMLLHELGLENVADDPIESLSQGHGRRVELGRALVQEPHLLLLDEPSSGLDTRETVDFATILIKLRDRRETAMLLVEHDIDLVRRVIERIYVLDFGKLIASGPLDEVFADKAVRRAYLGDVK